MTSDVAPSEYSNDYSQIYTIPRVLPAPSAKSPATTVKRVKFSCDSKQGGEKSPQDYKVCGSTHGGEKSPQDCKTTTNCYISEKSNTKVHLCSMHKQKLDQNCSG